jgi:hypothetical protein
MREVGSMANDVGETVVTCRKLEDMLNNQGGSTACGCKVRNEGEDARCAWM